VNTKADDKHSVIQRIRAAEDFPGMAYASEVELKKKREEKTKI
jgi:hypothetical protein